MLDYAALLIAFLISTVSAYYSISGLTAIFAGAVIPIIVMGSALEVGKVVTTLWLRKNWKQTGVFLKTYLSLSIIVLMLITSMGIFGFLSRAHLEQGTPSADIQAQIQLLDEKIQAERDTISANRMLLTQMDNSVNEIMGRSTDERGAARAVQIRRSQSVERAKLQKENQQTQQRIQQLQAERLPLSSQIRKIEVEVGPIKYIAALIYGDNPSVDFLERAVRWVIIVLVAVFDPLALALMLAVNRKRELDQQTASPQTVSEILDQIDQHRAEVTASSESVQQPVDRAEASQESQESEVLTVDTPVTPDTETLSLAPVDSTPDAEPEPPITPQSKSKKKNQKSNSQLESNTSPKSSKLKKSSNDQLKSSKKSPDRNELLKSKKSSTSLLKSSKKSLDQNELSKLKDQLKSKKLLKKLSNDQ